MNGGQAVEASLLALRHKPKPGPVERALSGAGRCSPPVPRDRDLREPWRWTEVLLQDPRTERRACAPPGPPDRSREESRKTPLELFPPEGAKRGPRVPSQSTPLLLKTPRDLRKTSAAIASLHCSPRGEWEGAPARQGPRASPEPEQRSLAPLRFRASSPIQIRSNPEGMNPTRPFVLRSETQPGSRKSRPPKLRRAQGDAPPKGLAAAWTRAFSAAPKEVIPRR